MLSCAAFLLVYIFVVSAAVARGGGLGVIAADPAKDFAALDEEV